MSSFEATLVGMGFHEANVKYALKKTGGASVQAALDYMINHPDADGADDEAEAPMEVDVAPKKVLTDEEKAEQKRMLEERIRAKRAEREVNESKEALAKEKSRREEGRMTASEKLVHQQRETAKVLERRKREKAEDVAAKKLIRQQLAADKARRAGVKAAPIQPKPAAQNQTEAPKPPRDYGECAVRFRLADGQQLTGKFKPTDTLAICFSWLSEHRKDKYDSSMDTELTDPLTRKSYTNQDSDKTMMDIGCVPRGVLMVKNHRRPPPRRTPARHADDDEDDEDDEGDDDDYESDDSHDN